MTRLIYLLPLIGMLAGCSTQADQSRIDSGTVVTNSAPDSESSASVDDGSADTPQTATTGSLETAGTSASLAGAAGGSGSNDWPWWRGPNSNGIAAGAQAVPVRWSDKQNVVWKTPVPGRGHSSPTVVGDQIVMATADDSRQIQSVVAFHRGTGRPAWKTDVNRGGFPKRNHQKNTNATCTVASDGERCYVAFYNHGGIQVTALDMQGKQVWQEVVGEFDPKQFQYGYAPSPVLYKSLVIVAADSDGGGHITALKRTTGKRAWQIKRPKKLSFSSPIVTNIGGRDQLLISGCEMVAAYDPANGKPLWSTPATTMATCGTMIWEGNLVFASGGYPKPETVCIRADGSGKIVWKNRQKCYEQSMLVHNGYVYAVTDIGIAFCWKADDGREMWKSRLSGPVSASPILAGGNIYLSNEMGTTYVFKANPAKFQVVGQNQLGQESFATPTICGSRIYLRVASGRGGSRRETLYCIGPKS